MPKFIPVSPPYKRSSFLAYWYANTNASQNLEGFLSKTSADLIGPQLKNFQQQKQNLMGKMTNIARVGAGGGIGSTPAGSAAAESVFELFEITQNKQDALRSIMEPGSGIVDLGGSNAISLDDIQAGINTLKTVVKKCNDFNKKVKTFQQGVQEIINGISPNGQYNEALEGAVQTLWDSYCEQAKLGAVNLTNAAESQQTQIAKQMILDIISRNNQAVFRKAASGNIGLMKMNAGIAKLVAAASALPNFDADTNFASGRRKTIDVKHSGGKITRAAGDANTVVDILSQKILGCVINMSGLAGELAAAYGFLKVHVLNDKFKDYRNMTANVEILGGQTFQIERRTIPHEPSLIQHLEAAERAIQEAEQVSKADVGIVLTAGGVSATLGFSVKNSGGKINDPVSTGRASITIQSGTNLGTLLTREAHLSKIEQEAIIELLATHGGEGISESQLNSIWASEIKPRLAQAALVDMLTGSTVEGKAYFMIAGNTLLSMESIIQDVMNNNNLSVYLSKDTGKNSLWGLNRSSFLSLNNWINTPTSAPNVEAGEARGYAAYSNVMARLNEVVIRMTLNIADIAQFRSLGL